MDTLRKPLFIIALILSLTVVLVEIGSPWASRILDKLIVGAEAAGDLTSQLKDIKVGDYDLGDISQEDTKSVEDQLGDVDEAPGLGIAYMALLDGLLLFTVLLIGAPFFISHRVHGRIQGIVTLIVSLLIFLGGIVMAFVALALVMVMIGLLLAFPFGTLVYMIIYGSFDRGGATAVLSSLMFLKLGFAICLALAHQRFLQNKGLVLIVLTSFLANIIIGFLHGLVPIFLVYITDGIAAIIVAILAILWALFLLVGSIISVAKAITSSIIVIIWKSFWVVFFLVVLIVLIVKFT